MDKLKYKTKSVTSEHIFKVTWNTHPTLLQAKGKAIFIQAWTGP
jgi:hypothetical protein